ncbi:UDP-3-O-(3-hydroxymyristoyl)glucosamine N-acyltransferase [Helicobacter trogontum]|uniref:UDP-3-O-acylglucosamine N-acyltransferase n=1 Tax=Helicobacter trogontum TaxID=50960 RepID=A0ABQ0D1G5_9HELI|nr:UDP-3-O-(3-hydroxymyristoyl)glucosamine N-acyltransferase [Helicobacter trogontum]MCI5786023.1 UDP-3-O-(3-hydroxymyristoyl)glucosamine N-acyltransferase [Helicobacter trogontum]MDY5185203.1 UDP-3-O-(3-hydroxymyristoyl)glucosamine N-acyltransferase [Helicobacter trogontum]
MKLSEAINKAFGNNAVLKNCITNDFMLEGLAPLESATQNQVSYIQQDKYIQGLQDSKAGAVLIRETIQDKVPSHIQPLIVDNPHLAFALLSQLFAKGDFIARPHVDSKIDTSASIAANVVLGNNVNIGANTVIMPGVVIADNVSIGSNCKIYPNVVIYRESVIGDRVLIHANSVIGSDGFGYAQNALGEHVKIEHNGRTIIEDDVEIGANNVIDRAVFGETRVKKGSKVGHSCVIAHNSVVGEHSLLVAQVGLAGSTTTGRNVVLGGQVGTAGHVHIGDFAQVAGRGAVSKNLPPKSKWGGHPIMQLDEWMKFYVNLRRMLKEKNVSEK